MSDFLNIFFLDSQTLGKPGSLEQVIEFFSETGFRITKFKIKGQQRPWREDMSENREILHLAYQAKGCWFSAFNPTWRFEIYQDIFWDVPDLGGSGRCYICTSNNNRPYFWDEEKNPPRHSRFFLDVGKGLYAILRPTFGWIEYNYEWLPTTHEDIEDLKLPALYWANFFGPAYMNKIGRDKILSAPAWTIEELSDGGVLYVLASSPGLAEDHVPIERVKAHFGVDRVR